MIMILMIATPVLAQLSPGPLSSVHEHLEGLRRCGECHSLGDSEVGPKCLECHVEIRQRRESGRGLHRGDDFAECVDCHVEHNGRDYALVRWPDGEAGFDHAEAGYSLAGAHARLRCRDCHNVKFVADPGALRELGKDLDRTYLGLPVDCAGCHADRHAGQFVAGGNPRGCADCHGQDAWKPAPGFDHDRAAFRLTGKHREVDCSKCHAAGGEPAVVRYVGLDFDSCIACHRDPHAGSLGPDCTSCHTTVDWKQVLGEGFDHDRTGYPLRGRHAAVTCAACHGGDRRKPDHARCTDCHADSHLGAGRARPRWTRCEDCHSVEGFRPADYTLARHDGTPFPLRGAHRAVPCSLCHRPLGEVAGRPAPYSRATDLAPAAAGCTTCHDDPHAGTARGPVGDDPCLGCHDESSWRNIAFDHAATGFRLDGRHAAAGCRDCHRPAGDRLRLDGAPRHCAGCHDDAHGGQFAERRTADGAAVDCAACHVTVDWLAEGFDHDRDSRFPLRGGHESVACDRCHRPLAADTPQRLRYKPLGIECRDCHVAVPAPPEGERS